MRTRHKNNVHFMNLNTWPMNVNAMTDWPRKFSHCEMKANFFMDFYEFFVLFCEHDEWDFKVRVVMKIICIDL